MSRPSRRVFSALEPVATTFGGAGHVNRIAHETLSDRFELVDRADDADLQLGTTIQSLAPSPRRFLLDHGAFADATYWAFAAPGLTSADTIAVTSRVGRDVAARMWDAHGPAIVDLPLFADTDVFRPPDDRQAARRAFARGHDLDASAPWILGVGSYSARKNTPQSVLVLEAVRAFAPKARLILVLPEADTPGHREAAAFLTRTIEERGLGASILRLPPMPSDELARVMGVADLLVHLTTCRLENFGLVVAEAMAAGLPVLAADWGGLRDLVVPGTTGWLAPTHLSRRGPRVRWHATVSGIAATLGDETRWTAISRASRERAERFSRGAFQDGLSAAVERALDARFAERPASPSQDALDLKFAAIWLQTRHPEVRDTSTLFRRLLDFEDGRFAELLLAPAATSPIPPPLAAGERAYPAVAYAVDSGGTLRVEDPAWAEPLAAGPEAVALARRLLEEDHEPLRADEVAAAEELARLGLI